MDSLTKLYDTYKQFALTRPDLVTDIETGIRWMSYFVPSKSRETAVLSELLFCASKLMALLHDTIYERYININLSKPMLPESQIFKFMKALNCVEVFTEIASAKFGGNMARWIIIVAIQVINVICRLVLMFKYNFSLITKNSLPEKLDRKAIREYLKTCPPSKNSIITTNSKGDEDENKQKIMSTKNGVNKSTTFTLKSTGRVIRTLSAGAANPPIVPGMQLDLSCPEKLVGEMIYTLRPLVHLLSLGLFGQRSWMPWFASFGMDVCSIYIAGKSKTIQPLEMRELNQRTLGLFLYLIRSPFYSNYSKRKILRMVEAMKRVFPIGNAVWNSIENYAELWDQIYFYSWES